MNKCLGTHKRPESARWDRVWEVWGKTWDWKEKWSRRRRKFAKWMWGSLTRAPNQILCVTGCGQAHTHIHNCLGHFHRVWHIVNLNWQWGVGYSEPYFIGLTEIIEMLRNVSRSWEYPEHWDNSVRNWSAHWKDFSMYVGGVHNSVSVCVFAWGFSNVQAAHYVHNQRQSHITTLVV